MAGPERRAQLMDVAVAVFAERGLAGASVEEIAARAGVSKPVVYEHFGGKENLYAAVVEREGARLLDAVLSSLGGRHPRRLLESAVTAILDFVEEHTDAFRMLVRGGSVPGLGGGLASLLSQVTARLEPTLARMFADRGYDPSAAPIYSQALVGIVAFTAQWWLDVREPPRDVVAAHLVNLAWNGVAGLEREPRPVPAQPPKTGSRFSK